MLFRKVKFTDKNGNDLKQIALPKPRFFFFTRKKTSDSLISYGNYIYFLDKNLISVDTEVVNESIVNKELEPRAIKMCPNLFSKFNFKIVKASLIFSVDNYLVLIQPPFTPLTSNTATLAQWVRAITPQTKGWVFESQPRQT